jgi:hypothetical protein
MSSIATILDLEVLVKEAGKIGNPTPWTTTTTNEDIPQLTTGFFNQLVSSTSAQDPVWATSPIVQIVQTKAIEANGPVRWRAMISDGTHILQVMMAPQLTALFQDRRAGIGSIVRVERFTTHTVQDRRYAILQPYASCEF